MSDNLLLFRKGIAGRYNTDVAMVYNRTLVK